MKRENATVPGNLSGGKPSISPVNTAFPIVCVGGSAGGLEAFQEFLRNLSSQPGMAFVFIMHLAPKVKSILSELLAKETKMAVHEIKNGMRVEINNVYVIPPNTNLHISSGRLILSAQKDPKHMPIDLFLESLSKESAITGIGIVMSGTGADGSIGIEALKTEGGITFAQDAKSSKFADMPLNAVKTGLIDFVLSPQNIARELDRMKSHPFLSLVKAPPREDNDIFGSKGFKAILELLLRNKKIDMTGYKLPTVRRRILRRMILGKTRNINDYAVLLGRNSVELENLYQELLINVTGFFRDPKVFAVIRSKILPAVLKEKQKDESLRLWVAGCSSGEEAYSYAICVLEALSKNKISRSVQIFATDINENNVEKARSGVYNKNIELSVSPERLRRFFVKEGNTYRVSKQLREMCVFSAQNIFRDPPFSNIDLVSCRNVLIYLESGLQKQIFRNFYYAVRPNGYLVLGMAESVGSYSGGFGAVDKRSRIFVKKYRPAAPEDYFAPSYRLPERAMSLDADSREKSVMARAQRTESPEETVSRVTLKEFAPNGVLIDSNLEIIFFKGATGKYLEATTGKPSQNVLKLARRGIFLPLRSAIRKSEKTRRAVKILADNQNPGGRSAVVEITVIPVRTGAKKTDGFMVYFSDIKTENPVKALPGGRRISAREEKKAVLLEKELSETREYLQEIVAEQEKTKEEMTIAGEEIQSSNEELQSTNEELETSKEELQSSNEELITSNAELQNRSAEVSVLNNDLANLLSSINMPVVVLGSDYCIRRITAECKSVLNISFTDIGRSIGDIKLTLDIPGLDAILAKVLNTLHSEELEIKGARDKWYSVFFRPYRTLENVIDGVVLLFVDISAAKKAQLQTALARESSESIVEAIQESLLILDKDMKVVSVNDVFIETFEVNRKQTVGKRVYDLGNGQWDIPILRKLLSDLISKKTVFSGYEMIHKFESIGTKAMLVSGRITSQGLILMTIIDITRQKELDRRGEISEERFNVFTRHISDIIWMLDENFRFTYIGAGQKDASDLFAGKVLGESFRFARSAAETKFMIAAMRKKFTLAKSGKLRESESIIFEYALKQKEGGSKIIETKISIILDGLNKPIGYVGISRNISERRNLEAQLIQSQKMEAVGQLAAGVSHEFNNLLTIMQLSLEEAASLKTESAYAEMEKNLKESIAQAAFIARRLNEFAKPHPGAENGVDVCACVDGALKMMGNDFRSKLVEVRAEYGQIPATRFDRQMFTQVLLNLFRNSQQAMPEGGVLTVKVSTLAKNVCITVEDTGTGIAKENLGKIFTPFYTTKGAFGSGETPGVGLGLAVSYSILKKMGGSISVESAPGKGAKFTILLPLKEAARPQAAKAAPAAPEAGKTKGKRILVCDDEEPIRVLLSEMLSQSGHAVETAKDGISCLKGLVSFKPDILLLDLIMPQTNIEELLRRISVAYPAMKKIIVTGAGNAELKHLEPVLARYGITKVVTKPFDMKALEKEISSALHS